MDIFLTAYLRPVADFLATYRTGDATRLSPLTAATKPPYRSAILARMNEHLRDHA
ncbi:hypothetical protein J2X55_001682 [Microbacterium sp. 1154]|uniref:hypothetical protein n=1 Tax=Microbacterium sp. 1154 TaxID=2817733 RepID=UPI000E389164|nr:hypothetical protein [Microbacterium sp. 1154]MDR6690783.1 hypothetical protein [Microbacterium sp. 1154]